MTASSYSLGRTCVCVILIGLVLLGTQAAAWGSGWNATVYVGQHFEVRDHDEPVKYVFNGSTRVARITGTLANTPRLQRFQLHAGWNLLSLAVTVTNSLQRITNSLPGMVGSQSVFCWDDATASWKILPSGQTLQPGSVLWLRSTHDGSLALLGNYSDPSNRVATASGSLVPSAGLEVWDLRATLSNTPSTTAWTFDNSIGGWLSWLIPPLGGSVNTAFLGPGAAAFMRTTAGAVLAAPSAALRVRYYHQDHLGSSAVVTGASGDRMEETAYHPFGACRNIWSPGLLHDPYGFTQKEKDVESRLHYFEARYLSAGLSRFITVDSKHATLDPPTASLTEPGTLNLYAYVLNNPMKHTDPTGFDPKPPAVSTPLVGAGRTFKVQGNGAVAVTLKNGVNVTILPDKFDLQPGEDPQTLPSIEPIQGQISSRTKKITYKITIQTRYPKGSDPSEKQAYGRGTTDQDVKAGNTSVRFHEGQHGASALDYVESHPLPQLNPMGKKYTQDWTWRDAADEWKTAFDTYGEGFQDFHVQSTDCVGHEPYFCK